MSCSSPEQALREAIREACQSALGIVPELVPLSYPPTATLGDLASPVCFELARIARKPPRAIAVAIAGAFSPGEHFR